MPARAHAVLLLATAGAIAASLASGTSAASAASVPPPNCRTIPVQADVPLQSDLARAAYDVDGTGVKIGIISNTFDDNPTNSTAAQDVADGLLPGPGNPCGYTTPVVVVEDDSNPASDDEGRGMAQLAHGIAPGAELFFASAGGTPATFTEALQELAALDVDIIIDDIQYFQEPMSQESTVATAIDDVVASGITYFSAAGNENVVAQNPPTGVPATPVNGWRTSAYRPTTCPADVTAAVAPLLPTGAVFDCMDFDAGPGEDGASTFSVDLTQLDPVSAGSTQVELAGVMQWGEPFGGSTARFEFVATTSDGADSFGSSVATDPIHEGTLTFDTATLGDTTDVDVSIVRVWPAAPAQPITPAIGFQFNEDGPQWIDAAEYWQSNDTDTVGRTIIGHNGAASAITVAATAFGTGGQIDDYSSLGPVVYYLEPQSQGASATALAAPQVVSKPSLLSVDAVATSVLSTPDPDLPGAFVFAGTSAATPNAAGVAALALQLDPTLTPAEIRALLKATAVPVDPPYATIPLQESVGAGLVNALNLLDAVAANLPPAPAPIPVPAVQPGTPVLADSGTAGVAGTIVWAVALLAAGAGVTIGSRTRRGSGRIGSHAPR